MTAWETWRTSAPINIGPDRPNRRHRKWTGVFVYNIGNVYIGTSRRVPEPSTWALMTLGFAGLGFAAYRTKKTARAAVAV